jgi:hypothetical protein
MLVEKLFEKLLLTDSIKNIIMDYEKTIELYKNAGQIKKWENTPEYNSYRGGQAWYDKVKSKRTGEFYQSEELLKREWVPPNWQPPHQDADGKPVKYPLKHVNEIYRKRLADGTEWLVSRAQWWGLDMAGNPINQTFNDKECFDSILPIVKNTPKTKERDSEMIREVTSIEHRIKYTLPFSVENVQKLYDMTNGRCNLVIMDESRGERPPYSVESFEHFRTREFDVLWDLVATPGTRWTVRTVTV